MGALFLWGRARYDGQMLISVVAAAALHRLPPPTVAERLTAQAIHDDGARALDKFARSTVDRTLIGRPVHQLVPVIDGDSRGPRAAISGSYQYADGMLQATLYLNTVGRRTGSAGEFPVAVFASLPTSVSSYVGQNGFGAKVRVRKSYWDQKALAFTNAKDDEPIVVGRMGASQDANKYIYSVAAEGSAARVISRDIAFIIDGSIAELSPGRLTDCEDDVVDPTIENPEDVFTQECWVGVLVNKVSLVRRSTGAVLKEWTLPSSGK